MPTSKTAPRRTVAQVQKEFDDFKKQVVDVAWNFEGGCHEGKVDLNDILNGAAAVNLVELWDWID